MYVHVYVYVLVPEIKIYVNCKLCYVKCDD